MANGPPTTLDPVQVQNSIQEAQIAAQGRSLYDAGTASVASARAAATTAPANCNDGSWDLTVANYNNASTDKNLAVWWAGGIDTDGITYPSMPRSIVCSVFDINVLSRPFCRQRDAPDRGSGNLLRACRIGVRLYLGDTLVSASSRL